MSQTLEQFDPVSAGFRVSEGPIQRKARRASTRAVPKPQYADAVWYSFEHEHPLEVSVPVRAVEDTVRKLKRAARYLERTQSTKGSKVEVRVQIGVEPDPANPKHSLVKFLGHEPWLLGRRVAKAAAEAGDEAREVPAPRQARHRRTTAATRQPAHARKASLRRSLVRPVITQATTPLSRSQPGEGLPPFYGSFSGPHTSSSMVIASELSRRYHLLTPS